MPPRSPKQERVSGGGLSQFHFPGKRAKRPHYYPDNKLLSPFTRFVIDGSNAGVAKLVDATDLNET